MCAMSHVGTGRMQVFIIVMTAISSMEMVAVLPVMSKKATNAWEGLLLTQTCAERFVVTASSLELELSVTMEI